MKLLIELDDLDPNVPNNIKHLRDLMFEVRRNQKKLHLSIINKSEHSYLSYVWPAIFHNVKVTIITPPKKKKPKIRNSTIFRLPVKAH